VRRATARASTRRPAPACSRSSPGSSDPYEEPTDADVVIDTTSISPEEAAQEVLLHLEGEGYLS